MQIQSALDAASLQARSIEHLWWWMFGVGGAIWLAVIVAMFYVVFSARGRRGADDLQHVPAETRARLERIVSGAVFATVLVLMGFLIYDFGVGRALAQHPSRALTIELIGHQWWWEVQYDDTNPSRRLVTANEIHIPTGEQVQLKLSAADVIHSFWVPNLNGKRDLIPGYTSSHWITAEVPGVYRGQCAEYCGMQHAHMALLVIAEPSSVFDEWRTAQLQAARPAETVEQQAGQAFFTSQACGACHTVRGTSAAGTLGPDLTHVASRRTIAAGLLPTTRGSLAAWIADPQTIKPGNNMPMVTMTPDQLRAVSAWLGELR